MPIPSQCKLLAAELEELKARKEDLQSQLPGLAGSQKWQVLAGVASLTRKIQAAANRLDACILAFGPGYRVDVVIIDLAGSVVLPVTGHIWHLFPPNGQSLVESEAAQNGSCAFVHPPTFPTGSIGLSIDEQGSAIFTGELFRSGALGALPGASAGFPHPTVEIVTPASVAVPASMITAPASVPGLPPSVTLSGAPSITLMSGAVAVAVTGTFATTLPIVGSPLTIPFAYTLTFALAPSGDINTPTRICAVLRMGPGLLTTTAGGLLGLIFRLAAPAIEPAITPIVVSGLEAAINSIILSAVTGAVPPGAIVSMRRIVITPSGLALFPAVGRFLP